MTFTRRKVFHLGAAALAAPALIKSSGAHAQPVVTLKLHHFLPPISNGHAKLLAPWAKALEQDSGGEIKVDIFPSMQLGGTPPQLYDQARDGVVDIVWTLPGSTPGRFPISEVFELPFVAARRAIVNAAAAQEFASAHFKDETKDVHVLSYWAHDHGLIHASKPIRTMEDLKGVKLRNPTRLAGEALKALGAVSIGMPAPQVPESLAQKVIDGTVVPWEVVPSLKVHELIKFHTEIPGSPTLYTASFFLAMNKARYEGLSTAHKAVIDKHSGQAFAHRAGAMWDEAGASVLEMIKKRGNTVLSISEEEKARWMKACEPVTAHWIEQVKAKGLDGTQLIAAAKALVAKHDKA